MSLSNLVEEVKVAAKSSIFRGPHWVFLVTASYSWIESCRRDSNGDVDQDLITGEKSDIQVMVQLLKESIHAAG
jgi:hypothetical protein